MKLETDVFAIEGQGIDVVITDQGFDWKVYKSGNSIKKVCSDQLFLWKKNHGNTFDHKTFWVNICLSIFFNQTDPQKNQLSKPIPEVSKVKLGDHLSTCSARWEKDKYFVIVDFIPLEIYQNMLHKYQ